MPSNDSLWNFGFVALNVLVLFAFCNLAVFFSFYIHLGTLSIPAQWHGALIGLLSASAMVIRPVVSARLRADNAVPLAAAGLGLTALCLLLYSQAQSLLPMVLLRILHGAAYVVMMSACLTLLMVFMPARRSGQGFGVITVMTLLPYAIVPPVLGHALPHMPLETVYARTALLMLPPALLLIPLTRRLRASAAYSPDVHATLPADCLRQSLRRPRVLLLLAANGLVFSVFSLMFFFLTTFTAQSGVGDPGLFFTVSTGMMIGIRLLFGHLFDRYDKATLAMASLAALAAGLLLLGAAASATGFYTAAAVYGAGVGAATPLMNSLMFAISPSLFRGLNTNLMLEMVDAGFFIGPACCGLALSSGLGRTPVLAACVACVLLAAALLLPLRHASPEEP